MSDSPQAGQVWQLKAYPETKADILGVVNWFDNRFVWLGYEDGRVDSMGEFTFMRFYEKDYSYTPHLQAADLV